MAGDYFVGVDVGTGGSRVLVIDRAGAVAGAAFADHAPFASLQIGWAEQDPHDWWRATCAALPAALRHAKVSASDIAAIALAGQMHGAVLLDEHNQVLRPALIWCDQRTQSQCDALEQQFGREQIIQWTANPPLTNFTLTKLLWVREHEPDLWRRFRHLLLPKDYVRLRLTHAHAIDMAEASGTLMLDVVHRSWSKDFLDRLEIPASTLPSLYESPEVCARVSAEGAAATGLREGTPVVAGAGDQAAGAVGMGIVRAGEVSATIGTSGVVFAATDRPALDAGGRIHTFCHALPNRWHVMGVTQAAGLSLRWFRDLCARDLAAEQTYDTLSREAEAVPAGSDGLFWTPYLMGERTPHLDPNARGALVGITASHTRGHITRAIMEGVAFSLKDTLTIFHDLNLPTNSVRLSGGGARSPLWQQIQADVYGQAVELLATTEGAAYGAALLAAVGAGAWKSVEDACAAAIHGSRFVSPSASCDFMQKRYAVYRTLYPRLKDLV